jgi:hypothetical protein
LNTYDKLKLLNPADLKDMYIKYLEDMTRDNFIKNDKLKINIVLLLGIIEKDKEQFASNLQQITDSKTKYSSMLYSERKKNNIMTKKLCAHIDELQNQKCVLEKQSSENELLKYELEYQKCVIAKQKSKNRAITFELNMMREKIHNMEEGEIL